MNDHDGLDDKLQQLYRKLPEEQPDARLDELILKAAGQQPSSPNRWRQPLAFAACVVMVGSLLLYWKAEQPLQLERALSVAKESAPAPTAKPVAPAVAPEADSASVAPPVTDAPVKPAVSVDAIERYPAAKAQIADAKARAEFEQIENRSAKVESEQKIQRYSAGSALALKDEKAVSVIGRAQGLAAAPPKRDEARFDAEPLKELAEAKAPVAAAPALAQSKAKLAVPFMVIEGVSLGMSLEQLQAMGFSCGNDVCRKQLSQPEQAGYWGMPSLNARFKVFLSHDLAYKLVLEQSSVDVAAVEAAFGQWGQATDKRCPEEKGELLVQRQQSGYLLLLRQEEHGAVLTICRAP